MTVLLYTCVCQKCSTEVMGFTGTSVLQSQITFTAAIKQWENLMMCLRAEGNVCGKCIFSGNSEYLCMVLCCVA